VANGTVSEKHDTLAFLPNVTKNERYFVYAVKLCPEQGCQVRHSRSTFGNLVFLQVGWLKNFL